ncbi:hypothetical protein [Epibacterium sp. Ofav1-8]|uniref:hypothetical protein n=1 Tax=Epibacterium sp. Ofav1-8 TaxID=2917735 RepID=UPI001EF45C1B|nr:hypothetical protein [Epibacterium sp. Ofav1-8]MCG7625017.1 hypothetical protein [Epibacterium sp. Ofav1-8]
MPRGLALAVLAGFALFGLAMAGWGVSDIASARSALRDCAAVVIFDTSALWFLALAVLPLFPALARLPERHHSALLAGIVVLALLLPAAGYLVLSQQVTATGRDFTPPLRLFSLQELTAPPVAGGCTDQG